MTSEKDPAGWMVFRCSGSETGNLEDKLSELGVSVWTPRVWFSKRVPRKKVRRVVLLAMLPSYLFVSEEEDQRRLMSLGSKHGFWGPMVIKGEVVVIADKDLEGLWAADDRTSAPKRWLDPIPEPVHVPRPRIVVKPADELTTRVGGGALVAPKSGQTDKKPQYGLTIGSKAQITSGPLASLGITGFIEAIEGGTATLSAFGGRVLIDLKDLGPSE